MTRYQKKKFLKTPPNRSGNDDKYFIRSALHPERFANAFLLFFFFFFFHDNIARNSARSAGERRLGTFGQDLEGFGNAASTDCEYDGNATTAVRRNKAAAAQLASPRRVTRRVRGLLLIGR